MPQITLLKVDREKQPKGYIKTVVSYKTDDGKVKAMTVMPFKEQEQVASAFADAKPGDMFNVNFRKNDRDFWEFAPVPIKLGEATQATMRSNAPSGGTSRGNWETTEERAQRQLYIIRQSSLERAIQFFDLTKNNKVSPSDVTDMAALFEQFVVYGKQEVKDVE